MRSDPKIKAIRYRRQVYNEFRFHIRRLDKNRCVNPDCRFLVMGKHLNQNHHVRSRGAGGSDVEENCFTLCMECHAECHRANLRLDWAEIHAARPAHVPFAEQVGYGA